MPDPGEPPPEPDDVLSADEIDTYLARHRPAEQEIRLQATLNTLELEVLLREAAGE